MALAKPIMRRGPRARDGPSSSPSQRERALRAAGVEPNQIVPLAAAWAAPRGWEDGVFKQGAVVLAGDMLLEALDGDAIARQELKQRQERRRQQRLKQMAMQKAVNSINVQWQAGKGQPGRRMEAQQMLILRRTPELSSEKLGKVPKGAVLHVLEMLPPTQDGVRRALVQDTWGKKSGWLTAVDVDGEANLGPVRETAQMDEELEDLGRGEWLTGQQELWNERQFPKHDSIQGQQEKDLAKRMSYKNMQQHQRQQTWSSAAGKKSVVESRPGGAAGVFRAARAFGAT